jgi:hypothetical protein
LGHRRHSVRIVHARGASVPRQGCADAPTARVARGSQAEIYSDGLQTLVDSLPKDPERRPTIEGVLAMEIVGNGRAAPGTYLLLQLRDVGRAIRRSGTIWPTLVRGRLAIARPLWTSKRWRPRQRRWIARRREARLLDTRLTAARNAPPRPRSRRSGSAFEVPALPAEATAKHASSVELATRTPRADVGAAAMMEGATGSVVDADSWRASWPQRRVVGVPGRASWVRPRAPLGF